MTQDWMDNEYFNWLCGFVCNADDMEVYSFRKLLMHLHSRHFRYSLPRDINRANDGVQLRYRYSPKYFDMCDEPCSVLEMMIALALRCEETIMDNARLGDRTGQWFWRMVTTMELNGMYDQNYDKRYVQERIDIMLDRRYEPNGKGGLFFIRDCADDLREVEIWCQLLWYLDDIGGWNG